MIYTVITQQELRSTASPGLYLLPASRTGEWFDIADYQHHKQVNLLLWAQVREFDEDIPPGIESSWLRDDGKQVLTVWAPSEEEKHALRNKENHESHSA